MIDARCPKHPDVPLELQRRKAQMITGLDGASVTVHAVALCRPCLAGEAPSEMVFGSPPGELSDEDKREREVFCRSVEERQASLRAAIDEAQAKVRAAIDEGGRIMRAVAGEPLKAGEALRIGADGKVRPMPPSPLEALRRIVEAYDAFAAQYEAAPPAPDKWGQLAADLRLDTAIDAARLLLKP